MNRLKYLLIYTVLIALTATTYSCDEEDASKRLLVKASGTPGE
jgi:hypothetical protein